MKYVQVQAQIILINFRQKVKIEMNEMSHSVF